MICVTHCRVPLQCLAEDGSPPVLSAKNIHTGLLVEYVRLGLVPKILLHGLLQAIRNRAVVWPSESY